MAGLPSPGLSPGLGDVGLSLQIMNGEEPPIGEQIRQARIRARLTQRQLAEALGVVPNTVTNWETGATSPDRHLAAIRSVLRATWTPGVTTDRTEPSERAAELNVRELPDGHLWLLHDEVIGEIKRRYRIATDQSNANLKRGVPLPLPEEARRSPEGGTLKGL